MASTFLSPHFILIPLFAMFMLSPAPLGASAEAHSCDPEDQRVLLAVKAQFGNDPFFSSWTPTTPCCGSWNGIGCLTGDGRTVTTLDISQTNFSGTIPLALFDLPHLTGLFLSDLPNLVGPIPRQLSQLYNLQFLTISHTNVQGTVPSDLFSNLTALQQLDLSFNRLSGSIPEVFSTIKDLFIIDLSGNQFSGTIPPNMFSRSPNPSLRLANNTLSGTIPAYFGNLVFIEIDLSGNHFVGDASLLFGRSKPTQKIILAGNQFKFDLGRVQFPQGILLELDLSHNSVYGKIPNQIRKLKNLEKVNLSYNNLCGKIPTGGRMASFDASSYAHNRCLCGTPLPPCK